MEDIKINEIEDISASVESNNINLTEDEEAKRESNDNVETTLEVDTEVEASEVEAKAQELMELVKAYNAMKRKEANKYQVSKKENKKKKAKRRMAKKSRR